MPPVLDYRAVDVFRSLDDGGQPYRPDPDLVRGWGMMHDRFLMSGRFGVPNLTMLAALLKASLKDGDAVFVDGEGVAGTFIWHADSTATVDGGVVLASAEGGVGRWIRLILGPILVEWWGAKGSGLPADAAANSAAFQACADFLKALPNGGFGTMLGTGYYIGDQIDCSTDELYKFVGFEGVSSSTTTVIAYFTGAGKALFSGTRQDASRTAAPRIRRMKIRLNNGLPGIAPRAYECRMAEWPVLEDVMIVGAYNNGAIDISGAWNGTFRDLEIWDVGAFLARKNVPDGVTFSGTAGTSVIEASADCFDVADEDTWFAAVDTTSRAGRHLIQTRDSATQVTLSKPLLENYSGAFGWFDGVKGSITVATSTITLELDADVLTSEHIGMTVVVPAGRTGPEGTTRPLITRIATVPTASTCTLVDPANRDVVDETIYFGPGVAIYDDVQAKGEMNYNTVQNCRIESFVGLAWFWQGVHLKTSGGLKAHGRAVIAEGTYANAYAAGVAQVSHYFNLIGGIIGDLGAESQAIGPYKVINEGMLSGLIVSTYSGAMIENQQFMYSRGCNQWAVPTVGSGYFTSDLQQADDIGPIFDHDDSITGYFFFGGPPAYPGKRSIDAFGKGGVFGVGFSSARRPYYLGDDQVMNIPIQMNFMYEDNKQRAGGLVLYASNNANARVEVSYAQDIDAPSSSVVIFKQLSDLYVTSTSALSGTTGTDGKVTIGLTSSNDFIQVENRSGGPLIYKWRFDD